jgi:hypothetical protein
MGEIAAAILDNSVPLFVRQLLHYAEKTQKYQQIFGA